MKRLLVKLLVKHVEFKRPSIEAKSRPSLDLITGLSIEGRPRRRYKYVLMVCLSLSMSFLLISCNVFFFWRLRFNYLHKFDSSYQMPTVSTTSFLEYVLYKTKKAQSTFVLRMLNILRINKRKRLSFFQPFFSLKVGNFPC